MEAQGSQFHGVVPGRWSNWFVSAICNLSVTLACSIAYLWAVPNFYFIKWRSR